MEKPNMPGMDALGAMTDTLGFVKKMWGGMGIPGMVAPTLSADEINKKISDLRAVESWLTLNMNMLRGTIQALEVQSGTIAALQSIGAAMGVGGPQKTEEAPPFESPFAPPSAAAPEHGAEAHKPAFEFPVWGAPAAAAPAPEPSPAAAAPEAKPASLADFSAAPANPAAWWNILQEQFQQAVSQALAGLPGVSEEPAPHSKPAAKTRAAGKSRAAAKRAPSKRKLS